MTDSPSRSELAHPVRVVVAGAGGRMGQELIAAVDASTDFALVAALDAANSPAINRRVGQSGLVIGSDLSVALSGADVFIDFTRPEGTMAHLAACRARGVRMVIGTTGLGESHRAAMAAAAESIALVCAPNMSVGVNVTLKLLEMAGKAFATGYDIEIIEAHHRHKVDAPSGTALKMGEVIAQAQGRRLQDCAVYAREGVTGPRVPSSIGFAAIRGGDIIGDHTVLFAGDGERIEISHKASGRAGYVQGSLRAAKFLMQHDRGLFDMFDVLGLR